MGEEIDTSSRMDKLLGVTRKRVGEESAMILTRHGVNSRRSTEALEASAEKTSE